MFKISSAKLTGSPGVSGWSQVHEFLPEDHEKLTLRGHFFATVAIKTSQKEVENTAIGRELLTRLHEEYFGNLAKTPYETLKAAVEKVFAEFASDGGGVEIAATSLVGGAIYAACAGGAKVCVYRNKILATILESTPQSSPCASGYPQEGDIIILGTGLFFSTISQNTLKDSLSSKDVDSCVEILAPMIHEKEDAGSLGAAFVSFAQPQLSVSGLKIKKPEVDIKRKLSGFLNKVARFIPEKKIYLRGSTDQEEINQGRKMTFSVGAILLILLVVSIGFGIRQKRIKDYKASYETQLTQAENNYQQALSLSSLSPDRSRELFIQSRQALEEIIAKGVKDSRVDELKDKIDKSQGEILGEYGVDAQMFLDLSLLSSGFRGDVITTSGDSLYILDKAGKKVVSVGMETKKSQVVAGPDKIEEPISIAAYEGKVYYLSSSGVYEVDAGKTKVLEKDWQADALLASYAGNLYILDKAEGIIYRYAGTSSGFSEKQNWLGAGVSPDFSDAYQWAIDGSVYVLFPSGKILKFSLGSPRNFSISGAYPNLIKIDAIFADGEDELIYFLDKSGSRVVATDKDGKYKAQYISDKIKDATGIAVSETYKKIILLTGDKLYSIDLK